MTTKLFDSELRLMDLLWENEPVSAKDLSLLAEHQIGWNKNTTYTVLKKLLAKNIIRREDPGFVCTSCITKKEALQSETQSLAEKFFSGSRKALFSALLEDEPLTREEWEALRELIEKR